MYHTISEFLHDWRQEKELTQKILNAITDDSLTYSSTKGRSLGRLAWHIITSVSEMGKTGGLTFEAVSPEAAMPLSAEEYKNAYKDAAVKLQAAVSSQWNDAGLNDEVNMYGQMWKKSLILAVLIRHQIHHRGQLTILMRQAGLKVPGIYGPSYEEWESMGMKPHD